MASLRPNCIDLCFVAVIKAHDQKCPYGRNSLVWFSIPEGESIAAGEPWQQVAEQGAESSHLLQNRSRESKLEVEPSPSDILLPARLYLPVTSPNSSTSWGSRVQILESLGDISHSIYEWEHRGQLQVSFWYHLPSTGTT